MNVGATCAIVFVLEIVMYGTMVYGMHRYGVERLKCLAETDKRVKLINDVCNGIRMIKYYCWEKPFKALIDRSRESELVFIRRIANVLAGYFDAVTTVIPKLMPVLCFAAYPWVTGESIPAGKASTLISLLKQIESSIFYSPWCISSMALMK